MPAAGSTGRNPSPPLPPSIYFGGCSWGAAFYVGVHKAMEEMWGRDFCSRTLIAGGSAGTIIAVLIALGLSYEETDRIYRKLASRAVAEGTFGRGTTYVEAVLREVFERHPDAHRKLLNRCRLGTTSFPCSHRWHRHWESLEDLLATVKGSFHIPFYCTPFINVIRGEEVVDGAYGFAGRDLPHGDRTLYVGIDPHAEVPTPLLFAL